MSLDALAERSTLGVIKATAIEELGMDSKAVWRRCLPAGPWRRLLPGIILLENGTPSDDQRIAAALLYGGPSAMVTGAHACRLHGLRPTELPRLDHVQLLVPHSQKRLSVGFVTIERTRFVPRPVHRAGVSCAPLIRATTDAARRIGNADAVGKLLIEAIQRGRCAPSELLAELNAGTKRGTALPRRVLGDVERLRSVAEAHSYALSRRLKRPPSHWNVNIMDATGRYVGCPDAWWDDVGLAWEIDSTEFHYSRDGYARTISRNARYAGAGIVVVQTIPSRVEEAPAAVLAEIEAAYLAASARPRPDVQVSMTP